MTSVGILTLPGTLPVAKESTDDLVELINPMRKRTVAGQRPAGWGQPSLMRAVAIQ